MGKIFYGVMGDARGHVNRARIVAREMPEHEYLFAGGGAAHALKDEGYCVHDLPVPATIYRDNRVDVPGTLRNARKVFLGAPPVVRRLARVIREFDPDLILTDYEFFTPRAARVLGRPCVSLDHQHILTHCSYEPPKEERLSRLMTCAIVRRLFSAADRYLITSFFDLPPTDPDSVEVFPPVVRRAVTEQRPEQGEHVLVYQTSPTFHRLFPALEEVDRPFVVYGFGAQPTRKNIIFKAPSAEGFLRDLAACRFALVNGGHNVISEALYLGKPVFSFPIENAYEQFINAVYVSRLGYGRRSARGDPSPEAIRAFDARLEEYAARIKQRDFFGNEALRRRLSRLIDPATEPPSAAV